jgi:hypothetical protein
MLPLAQFAFNAWPNATTKKAPFELIMGHIPRAHQTFRDMSSPPLNDCLALISQAHKDAADALRKSQELETLSSFIPYCIGDRVWLEGCNLHTTHPSAKLAPRRYGPFLVTLAISRTSFWLKLPLSWKIHNVFHASLLTPYKETPTNGSKYQEPAPDLIDGQPEWEVEDILGTRRRRNQLQYLVRWKGFSKAHDSWEPTTHISVTVSPSPQSKDEENEKLHKLREYARDFRRQHTTDAEQFDWDSDDGDYGLAIGRLVVT